MASQKLREETVHCSVAYNGKSILEVEIRMDSIYSACTFLWGDVETRLLLGTMGHKVPFTCVIETGLHPHCVGRCQGYQGGLSGK